MRTMDVVAYDPNWKNLFEEEKEILESILCDEIIRIEHFGSTSVEGLFAKPIVDIMVIVKSIDNIDNYNEEMQKIGYESRGECGIKGRRFFRKFNSDNSGNHTHHVHMYESNNAHVTDELTFRNYLRVELIARKEYEDLKLSLSKQFHTDPKGYTNGKAELVNNIMESAKKYYEATNKT